MISQRRFRAELLAASSVGAIHHLKLKVITSPGERRGWETGCNFLFEISTFPISLSNPIMSAELRKDLSPAPTDGVTKVAFNRTGSRLLYTTWGGVAAVHNSTTGLLEAEGKTSSKSENTSKSPAILDSCWTHGNDGDTHAIAVGCLDGRVLSADATLSRWTEMGRHDGDGVRGVVHNSAHNILLSGGWDGFIRCWDTRSPSRDVNKVKLGGKCYGLAAYGSDCIVAITSTRHVVIADVRKPTEFVHDKVPAALSYQLRGISSNATGTCYVVGSTEGKIVVEWPLDEARGYSFRCHRAEGRAYPVNCIVHTYQDRSTDTNENLGSFATGGGDGHVAIWDGDNKKRIVQHSLRC